MGGEAVLGTLRHVWLVLKSLHVPGAVAGGLAMAVWKHVRATKDVDLLIAIGGTDLEPFLGGLAEAGIRSKRQPPLTPLGQLDVIQLVYEPPETFLEVQVDLLVARSEYYETALHRRIATRLPNLDVEIAVLACEDLILHKLLAGRIIDRADAASLLRANRKSLDMNYVRRWAKQTGTVAELTEVWQEAFLGESLA